MSIEIKAFEARILDLRSKIITAFLLAKEPDHFQRLDYAIKEYFIVTEEYLKLQNPDMELFYQ